MYKVVAPFMQIQALCSGVGAYQDQVILSTKTFCDTRAYPFRIWATDRQHLPGQPPCFHGPSQTFRYGILAVCVFSVEEYVCPGLRTSD